MGSFNTTCFATRQTIAPDDGALIFPVVKVNGYASIPVVQHFQGEKLNFEAYGPTDFIYPNALWHPMGFAFRATYDDYGNFNLEKSSFNRKQLYMFYRRLKDWACHTPKGSNPYHEKEFTLTDLLKVSNLSEADWESPFDNENPEVTAKVDQSLEVFWDELQAAIFSSRVFIRHPRGNHQPAMLRFAVASQVAVENSPEAYAHLASIYEGGSPYTPSAVVYANFVTALKQYWLDCLNNQSKPTLEGVSQALIPHCNYFQGFPGNPQLEAVLQLALETQDKMTNVALQYAIKEVFTLLKHIERALFQVGERSDMDGLEALFVAAVAKELQTLKAGEVSHTLSEEFTSSALNPLMKISEFLSLLNALTVPFTPMMCASQDYSNDLGKAYARWVSSTCQDMPRSAEQEDQTD